MNEKLVAENISVSTTFLKIRSTRRAGPKNISDPLETFEISCHSIIVDAVSESMKRRYASHGDIYMQISCFDPSRFYEVQTTPEMIDLKIISEAIPKIDTVALQEELVSFASSYKHLQKGLLEDEMAEKCIEPGVKEMDCTIFLLCAFKLLCQQVVFSSL